MVNKVVLGFLMMSLLGCSYNQIVNTHLIAKQNPGMEICYEYLEGSIGTEGRYCLKYIGSEK